VPRLVEKILTERLVETEAGDRLPLTSSVSYAEGTALQQLVTDSKAEVALEIGLAYGISAMFIGAALRKTERARHYIVDPNQRRQWHGVGLLNLKRSGLDGQVELMEEPSFLALPELVRRGVRVDFAFIDGYHTFDHVLLDVFFVDLLLNVGGIVALDDLDYPSIAKVSRYIATNRAYRVMRTSSEIGRRDKALRIPMRRTVDAVGWTMGKLARPFIKPEYVTTDASLGLNTEASLVAFEKQADDSRRWDYHRPF
jgi:predicted O-methyltransferase YrrM